MFIQFGIINYKLLFILLFPFLYASQEFWKNKDENNNPFFLIFITHLSFLFFGIIHLISKFLTKSEKEEEKKKESKESKLTFMKSMQLNKEKSLKVQLIVEKEFLEKEKYNFIKKRKNFYMLLICSFQLIGLLIRYLFKDLVDEQLCFSLLFLLQLIFFIIFSMIFLRFSLYLHQYVSIGIYFICLVIFFLQSLHYNKNLDILKVFQSFFYSFSVEKAFCICDVLGKKYLNLFMDGIYLLLFKVGITGLIIIFPYDMIAYFCGLDDEYHGIIKTLFFNFSFKSFIINLVYEIIFFFGLWTTINNFSPCHFIILDILQKFFKILIVYFYIEKDEYSKEQILTFYILFPILFFCSLLFNEIIILKFCGLNKNTKLYIMKREKTDMEMNTDSFLNDNSEENLDDCNDNNYFED